MPVPKWTHVAAATNGHSTPMNGTARRGPQSARASARSRSGCGAARGGRDPLAELKELLRTAGVATAGDLVQLRAEPDPDRYLGRGKLAELRPRSSVAGQPGRLRRRAGSAPGAQPREGARRAGDRPHRGDPRHLRRPRPFGRGQAPSRARPARIQPGADAWSLDPPRAPRCRPPGRRPRGTEAPASPRSRPTGGWPGTGSRAAAPTRAVERNRGLMRARRERSPMPTVALAGYTNAGKSTLLNALTGAGVGVGNALPHARPDDPGLRARRPALPGHRHGRLHPQAPHQLIEAFKATLEETGLADLILHVVDGSEPERERPRRSRSTTTLEEIGAGDRPRLLVLNKLDLLGDEERRDLLVGVPEAIGVSGERRRDRRAARSDRVRVRGDAARGRAAGPVRGGAPGSPGLRDSPGSSSARSCRRRPGPRAGPAAVAHRFEADSRPTARAPLDGRPTVDCAASYSTRTARLPAGPRRRRGARPLCGRGGAWLHGRAGERRHRDRGRDPAGSRRARPAALRPRDARRDRARQRPGPDRPRVGVGGAGGRGGGGGAGEASGRAGAEGRSRSDDRRGRRSSAAAGRAGRCRSGCVAHALEPSRPLLPCPAITRPRGSTPGRGRCARRGSRSRRSAARCRRRGRASIATLPIRRGPGSRTVSRSTSPRPAIRSLAELVAVPEELVAAADREHDGAVGDRRRERLALAPQHVPGDQALVAVLAAADVDQVVGAGVEALARAGRGVPRSRSRATRSAAGGRGCCRRSA